MTKVHSRGAIAPNAGAAALLFLQPVAHAACLELQFLRIETQRILVNAVPRMRLDHLPEFKVATNRAQLHIREPFPRRTLLFQIIKKSVCTRYERSILAVRTQTQIDTIQVSLTRNTRKRRDHQLDETRVSLILRQRLDRRRHERVVSEQNDQIRSVINAGTPQPAQTIKGDP